MHAKCEVRVLFTSCLCRKMNDTNNEWIKKLYNAFSMLFSLYYMYNRTIFVYWNTCVAKVFIRITVYRVLTIFEKVSESPGLKFKNKIPGLASPWKAIEVLESPGIFLLLCYRLFNHAKITDFKQSVIASSR